MRSVSQLHHSIRVSLLCDMDKNIFFVSSVSACKNAVLNCCCQFMLLLLLQAILRRIQTVQPQYSLHTMETEYVTHKQRARSLSLFPPITVSYYSHHYNITLYLKGNMTYLPNRSS